MSKEESNRLREWQAFSYLVGRHIENYTVPQYGDAPEDEIQTWSLEQCQKAISKYTKRFDTQRRGRLESLRDLTKLAHFACLAFNKMFPNDEELTKIIGGTT